MYRATTEETKVSILLTRLSTLVLLPAVPIYFHVLSECFHPFSQFENHLFPFCFFSCQNTSELWACCYSLVIVFWGSGLFSSPLIGLPLLTGNLTDRRNCIIFLPLLLVVWKSNFWHIAHRTDVYIPLSHEKEPFPWSLGRDFFSP